MRAEISTLNLEDEKIPLNNLGSGDKEEILEIYKRIESGEVQNQDYIRLFNLSQDNYNAFSKSQLKYILRIAEVLLDKNPSKDYILSNIQASFFVTSFQ
ncbi:hypothetical protein D3C75_241860 [compost metagenome]